MCVTSKVLTTSYTEPSGTTPTGSTARAERRSRKERQGLRVRAECGVKCAVRHWPARMADRHLKVVADARVDVTGVDAPLLEGAEQA